MKGAPQRPSPNKLGLSIPVRIRLEPEVPVHMPDPRPARKEEAPRKSYIMKRHYEEHGYTEGCDGCGRLSAGMEPRALSDKCRKRMEEAMKITERKKMDGEGQRPYWRMDGREIQ